MPRLLIVAPSFTPGNQTQSFRARKLLEQLRNLGFEVSTDAPLEQFFVRERARRERAGGRRSWSVRRLADLCWRAVWGVVSVPDRTIWAVLRLRREILAGRRALAETDVILVTAPPYLLLWLGVAMKSRLKSALVIDLRDDWTTNARVRWWTPVHRLVAKRIERRAIKEANAVVLNTEVVARRFAQRYAGQVDKLIVVTNGYDEADFACIRESLPPEECGTALTLGYFGSDYEGFAVESLGLLCERMRAVGQEGRLTFRTGGMGAWRGAGRRDIWVHHGALSEAESAIAMAACHVLLLLMPEGESEPSGTIPLKAFAYLRSKRFIVYVGERGATTDLLETFPGTKCLPRSKMADIPRWCLENEAVLRRWYERPGLEMYSVAAVARRMKEVLIEALAVRETEKRRTSEEKEGPAL